MNRLRPTIDLSYSEQEVLQRVLTEPRKIADALAPDDAREHSRIIGVPGPRFQPSCASG